MEKLDSKPRNGGAGCPYKVDLENYYPDKIY